MAEGDKNESNCYRNGETHRERYWRNWLEREGDGTRTDDRVEEASPFLYGFLMQLAIDVEPHRHMLSGATATSTGHEPDQRFCSNKSHKTY